MTSSNDNNDKMKRRVPICHGRFHTPSMHGRFSSPQKNGSKYLLVAPALFPLTRAILLEVLLPLLWSGGECYTGDTASFCCMCAFLPCWVLVCLGAFALSIPTDVLLIPLGYLLTCCCRCGCDENPFRYVNMDENSNTNYGDIVKTRSIYGCCLECTTEEDEEKGEVAACEVVDQIEMPLENETPGSIYGLKPTTT